MTKSIPVATPPITTRRRSHTSAMNDDMLGYLEHLIVNTKIIFTNLPIFLFPEDLAFV